MREFLREALQRVTLNEFEEIVNRRLDAKIKELGLDKIDAKYGVHPGITAEEVAKLKPAERCAGGS